MKKLFICEKIEVEYDTQNLSIGEVFELYMDRKRNKKEWILLKKY